VSIEGELYGGGMARALYGPDARHVPAWLYVQDQGPGTVGLVGASMTPGRDHPLTYGAGHYDPAVKWPAAQRDGYYAHHFLVGEIIVRPRFVIATRALEGTGIAGLYTGDHDIEAMLAAGRLAAGTSAQVAEVVHGSRRRS
jgi:hypothetical protein